MIKQLMLLTGLLAASMSLTACGDKAEAHGNSKKSDAPSYTGTVDANKAYSAQGWTAGDKASWEQQMRARSQSQNEYVRTN